LPDNFVLNAARSFWTRSDCRSPTDDRLPMFLAIETARQAVEKA